MSKDRSGFAEERLLSQWYHLDTSLPSTSAKPTAEENEIVVESGDEAEVLQQTSSEEDAGEILYDSGSDRLESPSPVIQVESPPLKRRKYNPRRKEHEFTFLGMKASCQRSLSEFSSLTNYVL